MDELRRVDPALLTPATEMGAKAFFEGLCAIRETLTFSAAAGAAVAITPSLRDLVATFCSGDPRYQVVMANVWVQDYQAMKQQSLAG